MNTNFPPLRYVNVALGNFTALSRPIKARKQPCSLIEVLPFVDLAQSEDLLHLDAKKSVSMSPYCELVMSHVDVCFSHMKSMFEHATLMIA